MAAKGRAYPRVIGGFRDPSWIFFEIAVPILNSSAFVFLYRAMHAPDAYVGFVVLGSAIAAYWANVIWMMATQLHWDRAEGYLELYILAPVSMMAFLLGMAAGGLFIASIRAALIAVLLSLIFHVQFTGANFIGALEAFLITMVALYGLGMLLSSLFLFWGREAWQLALAIQEPVYFLTGLNFPLSKLFATVPGAVSLVSALIPISLGLDALRQYLFPGQLVGVFSAGTELLLLLGLGVIYITAAYFMLKRMEWLARVEARLSIRWQ